MNNKNDHNFIKARDYAFMLLKFRMRSQQELYQRLKRKKFEKNVIEQVIDFLQEKGFLNDREFARMWLNDRLKMHLGIRRITRELEIKGIDKSIITDLLIEVKQGYDEDSVVLELVKARSARYGNLEPKKARSRLYAYLLRRGFSCEVISDAINKTKL